MILQSEPYGRLHNNILQYQIIKTLKTKVNMTKHLQLIDSNATHLINHQPLTLNINP